MGGFLVRKQIQELTWRASAIELEMPSGPLCSRWNPSTSPPATFFYQRCHWIVSSPNWSRLWRGQGRFHFLSFYVCSANQDQFYYISFIRGNHLGPHDNKHIGFFPPPSTTACCTAKNNFPIWQKHHMSADLFCVRTLSPSCPGALVALTECSLPMWEYLPESFLQEIIIGCTNDLWARNRACP